MNYFKNFFSSTSKNASPISNPELNSSKTSSSSSSNASITIKNNPENESSNPKPPVANIKISIRLLNSLEKQVTVDRNMTGQLLKKYIYQKLDQELEPNSMSLYYEGTKVTKNMKLGQLNLVVGNQITIRQTKLDISEVSNIIADVHGIDPITEEVGVAKMSCGHHIGTDCMTGLVRSLISESKYQIRCPNVDEDSQKCLAVWDFRICKKIGVFTKSQIAQFEEGLSKNWIKEFTKQCPKCKMTITKIGLDTNRVRCPSCNFGDFCYMCLNKWKGSKNEFCGNEECKFLNDFLVKAPWNKKFNLKVKTENNIVKQFITPQYRGCPNCRTIIEHKEACKHMQCTSCHKSFCWVCLSVKDKGWPCGSFNEYCGKVAQLQKFNSG